MVRAYEKVLDLSYGENPHQRAAYYAQAGARTHLLSMVSKLHGKELSFNNLLDLDTGRRLVDEFEARPRDRQAQQPLRVAVGASALEAYKRRSHAIRVGLRRRHRPQAAGRQGGRGGAREQFVEVLFAPGYDDEALEILSRPRTCASSTPRAPPPTLLDRTSAR